MKGKPNAHGGKQKSVLSRQKRRGQAATFNEETFHNFMTGIHQRKLARKSYGHAQQVKKDRITLLRARTESRASLKNAIAEHFGEITVSEDGDIKYSKTPFADPAAEPIADGADGADAEEDEDEEVEDDVYEDENAVIMVETTDMHGKKVKPAPVRNMQTLVAEEEEDEVDMQEAEEDAEEEESSDDETAVERNDRMMELLRQMGGDMSDFEEAGEESQEEAKPQSTKKAAKKATKVAEVEVSKPTKKVAKAIEAKANVAEVKPTKKAVKATATKSVEAVEAKPAKKATKAVETVEAVEKPTKKAKATKTAEAAVEEPKPSKTALKKAKRAAEEEPKLTKAQAKKAKKVSSVASEKATYMKLFDAEDDTMRVLDTAVPTLTEAMMLNLPKPTHWDAEKYRKQAMSDAAVLEEELQRDRKPTKATPDDHRVSLAEDDTYGWEEGETCRDKSFGLINGMPPACLGGRHRKKPLSKKKDNSHNGRKERQRQREKAEEEKRHKEAFEGGHSMSAHGFGYISDDDDDVMMMGKNNKKRKVIEARQNSMKKAMDRQADADKAFGRGGSTGRGRGGFSRGGSRGGARGGSARGPPGTTRKSYFFGSKDGAVNL